MTFDSRTGQVLLFGGWGETAFNDTWFYDPRTNAWTNRSPAVHPYLCGSGPGTAAMVYNSAWNRVILFGGCSSPHAFNPNETWAYDPTANVWSQRHPASSPNVSHDFGLEYDARADRVLLFGGASVSPHYFYNVVNGLLAYDYAGDMWTVLAAAGSPSPRMGHGMAYDARAERTILFGGCTDAVQLWPYCRMTNETWAYDSVTNAWTNRSSTWSPPPAVGLPMVYDSLRDRVIMFGEGWGTGNATWAYDYVPNAWTNETASGSPPTRYGPSMAYDSSDGKVVLFGGIDSGFRNDTWSYGYPATSGVGGGTEGLLGVPVIVWIGTATIAVVAAVTVAAILWSRRGMRGRGPGR
jgi:N-acetylneuraminic acid mutarotase